MKAVIVLPTYNEKENIRLLIPQILKVFKSIKKFEMNLLVVDDKSPDGTADEVKKFQKKNKNIFLLKGDKQGLGIAYLRGFDYAITKLGADILMEMDADLSHPAEMIPRFMESIDGGNDLVIGSRYISGGGTPDWNFSRKLISFTGNFFARIVSGMYGVHDCTSGFRAIKVEKYKKIDTKNLHTRGYAFQSTLLYELFAGGAKIKEIPLVFYDRKHGHTKLQKKDLIEFFFNAFRLRLRGSKRLIKFTIVGSTGLIVNMFFLWAFTNFLNMHYAVASPIAVEFSIIWNFLINNYWTFNKTKNKSSFKNKILKFHTTAFGGFLINYLVLIGLTELFGIYYLISNLIGIAVAFFWNYLASVKWTWRE